MGGGGWKESLTAGLGQTAGLGLYPTHAAAGAGRADDVKKYSDQIAQIDPASPWTQRVMALKAALPVAGVAAPAVEAKKADAAPEGGIQVKLPGK